MPDVSNYVCAFAEAANMKTHLLLIISIILSACSGDENTYSQDKQEVAHRKQIKKAELQSMIDSAKVEGSVLIYDFQKEVYYSNDFRWANKGHLPASTFKIAHSIIALESGVVADDRIVFKWDGKKRSIKNWEQDLILRDAFHVSCVPCYQEVARKIGEKRMNEYLAKFNYG